MVAQGIRGVKEQGPVRIPKDVLDELEAVRQYARAGVLDIPTLRYVAMERDKPALAEISEVRMYLIPGDS